LGSHYGKSENYRVGPRDGLQNIKTFVPADKKILFIKKLAACVLKKFKSALLSPASHCAI